jgi:cytochrome P450
MPFQVFFNLVGLPAAREEGREQLERWVHELKDREPDDPRLTPVAKAATAGVQDYFVQMLNERSRNPREDLVTHLVNAEIDGVPFAEEHIKPTSSHRIKRGSASLRTDLRRGAQLDSRPLHE